MEFKERQAQYPHSSDLGINRNIMEFKGCFVKHKVSVRESELIET